jgi:molybdopterin converting factor small subunit
MAGVTFLGEVRKAAGQATVGVEADSVRGLLAALHQVVSPIFASLLFKNGVLQPDVEVLVNGRNIEFLKMLDTSLRPTDQVTIFGSSGNSVGQKSATHRNRAPTGPARGLSLGPFAGRVGARWSAED